MADQSPLLIEQMTIEILGIHEHLSRLRESFGVVTQWEAGAWMILQFLEEQGRCRTNTLLQEQHLSEGDALRVLNALVEAGLLNTDEHHPAIHAHYEINQSGRAALGRLRMAMHDGFSQFDADFEQTKLKTAVDVLKQYRHRLECMKLGD